MKKRFSLACVGLLLSMLLVFTGCGEGKGAEDTGDDGKVGDKSKSTTLTSSTTVSSTSSSKSATTSATTSSTTPQTAATSGNRMMDDARDLVEDVLPGSQGDRKTP